MEQIKIGQGVRSELAGHGFAWIPRAAWSVGPALERHWERLVEDWERLEPDRYLDAGAKFRLRRYGRYSWSPVEGTLAALPNEPYFQPEEENRYAGGIDREFAPLLPDSVDNPFLHALVRATFACLPVTGTMVERVWEVRVHQVRLEASPGKPGFPAPEGIHQDGTDFLTLHLVRRRNIVGGKTTIYDLKRNPIRRYTLRETLDSLILEDGRVMHGVTPVYPADGSTTGTRDLLGLDFLCSPAHQRSGLLR